MGVERATASAQRCVFPSSGQWDTLTAANSLGRLMPNLTENFSPNSDQFQGSGQSDTVARIVQADDAKAVLAEIDTEKLQPAWLRSFLVQPTHSTATARVRAGHHAAALRARSTRDATIKHALSALFSPAGKHRTTRPSTIWHRGGRDWPALRRTMRRIGNLAPKLQKLASARPSVQRHSPHHIANLTVLEIENAVPDVIRSSGADHR